jgi:repressor of nif and glnA expression
MCAVGKLLMELPESMSLKLKQTLQNHNVTAVTIALLLNEFGFDISGTTVRRHRRRMDKKDGCKCNHES